MTTNIIIFNDGSKGSSPHKSASTAGTAGTAAIAQQSTITSAAEREWSKAEDDICWSMIKTMERFAPNVRWPCTGAWRAGYSLRNVATPSEGRTEAELRRRCITLVDQRHAQRLAQAQAKGDGSLSVVARQDKSPAPQLNVTLPKSQAPKRNGGAGEDAAKGEGERKEGESSKEQSDEDEDEVAEASRSAKVTSSKPMRLRKSIVKKIKAVKKMKAARRGRKQASLVLKGNFESFKVKKLGRRSKIITFEGKGTIRVPT